LEKSHAHPLPHPHRRRSSRPRSGRGPGRFSADYPVLRGSQQTEDAPPRDFDSGTFNWTGFYVGGFAGQTQTRFRTDRGVMDLANGLLGEQEGQLERLVGVEARVAMVW
jgi:hypothetical protein